MAIGSKELNVEALDGLDNARLAEELKRSAGVELGRVTNVHRINSAYSPLGMNHRPSPRYVDDDGYLYFVGRSDDIIVTRGEKVSPLEVENVLHEIDADIVAVGNRLGDRLPHSSARSE